MKSDKLFLAWHCSNCAKIKTYILKAMFDSSIVGADGQMLCVIHTFSNDATREILDIFGLEQYYAPVLLTHRDEAISGMDAIVAYLENNGFVNK